MAALVGGEVVEPGADSVSTAAANARKSAERSAVEHFFARQKFGRTRRVSRA
jgi:hypothetical protein